MKIKVTIDKLVNTKLPNVIKTNNKIFSSEKERETFYIGIATKIIRKAKYYAPVKTGFMRDNIKLYRDESGFKIISKAPYSIYPHEIMENKHVEPTKAKFLEDAAIEVATEMNNIFQVSIEYEPELVVYIDIPDKGSIISESTKEERDRQIIWDDVMELFNMK